MVKDSTTKKRGSRMHGRGKKRGRGAGLKGGRGHSGSMSHKFIHYYKYKPDHFAHRKGFSRPAAVVEETETLNVGDIDELLDSFREEGVARDEGDLTVIDLEAAGVDKLLGGGRIRSAVRIQVGQTTDKATEKVESAGGAVELQAVTDDGTTEAPEEE